MVVSLSELQENRRIITIMDINISFIICQLYCFANRMPYFFKKVSKESSKYFGTSSKVINNFPPAALSCPPPLKNILERAFTEYFPLDLNDTLIKLSFSTNNADTSTPSISNGKFTK